MTNEPDNDKTDDSTADDDPTFPFEEAVRWNYDSSAIGEVVGDLDEYADYEHANINVEYLQELLDIADTFGWDHVHLALCDERPLVLQNVNSDDRPTLALAPRIYGFGDE